jgi:hypothetical protein
MFRICAFLGVVVLLFAPSARALDVTFAANASALTIINDGPGDLNTVDPGVIDFDLTASPIGGVLSGAGRVQETTTPLGFALALGGPPAGQGFLQNVSGSQQSLSVLINSSPATAGPPLGWNVVDDIDIDDPTLGPIFSGGGLLELIMNQSTTAVPLGAVPQPVVTAPTSIFDSNRATNSTYVANESQLSYVTDLEANDRILIDDLQVSSGLAGSVYNQLYRCIDRMNVDCYKLADIAAKVDAKCVKVQFKVGGGNATACVDDPLDPKTDAREARLLADHAANCAVVPAWGVNAAKCCENGTNEGLACASPAGCPGGICEAGACTSHEAESVANDLSHELFGPVVAVSAASGKYQANVLKIAEKALNVRWSEFRACKRANVQTITNDVDLVNTCLGPPQPDPAGSIAAADSKVAAMVTKTINAGFTPVGAEFAGACTAVGDPAFPGCVAQRTQCAFCRRVNVADDIVPALDCDLFDDGTMNGSCP